MCSVIVSGSDASCERRRLSLILSMRNLTRELMRPSTTTGAPSTNLRILETLLLAQVTINFLYILIFSTISNTFLLFERKEMMPLCLANNWLSPIETLKIMNKC